MDKAGVGGFAKCPYYISRVFNKMVNGGSQKRSKNLSTWFMDDPLQKNVKP